MTIEEKPLTEITKEAIDALSKEIGIANTIRFIGQFTTGHWNYTKNRDQLFKDMKLDDIVVEMKKARQK